MSQRLRFFGLTKKAGIRSGFSMILALVITGVAVAMIVAGFSYISFAQQSGLLQRQQIASLGLGYGGLNQAIAELRRNPDYTGGFVGQATGLSSGEYRIFVSDYGPNKLVSVRTYTPSQAHLLRSCRLYQAIYSPARQTLVARSFQELNESGCKSAATPSPIVTPTVSPTVSPTGSASPGVTPTASPTASIGPTPTISPAVSPTATPIVTPIPSSTPTPTPSSGNGLTGSLRFFIDLGLRADDVERFLPGRIFAYAPDTLNNLPTGQLFAVTPVRDRIKVGVFVAELPFKNNTVFQPGGLYCLEIGYKFRPGSESERLFGLSEKTTYTDLQNENNQAGFFTLTSEANQAVRGNQIKDRAAGDSTCPRNLR